MHLFYDPAAIDGEFVLNKEESNHAIKVLRKQLNEEITIIDGKGSFYTCIIIEPNPKACALKSISIRKEKKSDKRLHVAIAPTKNIDRTEWFVEKAVEIGVDEISFILCQNSERKQIKLERIYKKAISAMKQSLKATLPIINEMTSIKDLLTSCDTSRCNFIAHVDDQNSVMFSDECKEINEALVVIGPEGDFSDDEILLAIENGFKKVSLGKSRLRTETAGIFACACFAINSAN